MSIVYALAAYFIEKRRIKSNLLWVLVLALWLVAISLATLHRQSSETVSDGFQPLFQSYIDAQSNSESYRQNFLNIVLFFPGGLFLQSLFPARWPKVIGIIIPTLLLGGLSFAIELIQLYHNLGLAQMDDILHNTIGAFLGAIVALVIRILLNKITGKRQK